MVSELCCSNKPDGDTSKLESVITRHAIPPTSVTPAPFEGVRQDRCGSSTAEAFLTLGAVRSEIEQKSTNRREHSPYTKVPRGSEGS